MAYDLVKWPFGKATVLTPDMASIIAIDARNNKTIVNLSINADVTLNVTPDAQLAAGAELILKVTATNTGDDVTLGTSIDGPNIVGAATKTKTQGFVYNGTAFIPTGAAVQID
ncbi:MAG TPA: hypothetical protein VL947_07060 [Cytophagales bacterium]|nr:hypothetical protein [Cytophagales bacterium]